MAFILATDFDFIAYMSKMAFFWKLFSRQWRFWNMIYITLYNVLLYLNKKTKTNIPNATSPNDSVFLFHQKKTKIYPYKNVPKVLPLSGDI